MGLFEIFKKKDTTNEAKKQDISFDKNSLEKNEENNNTKADVTISEEYEITKKATIFETGGGRPTKELLESWIGAVNYQKEEDKDLFSKENFKPLAMIFLENLPYVPESVSNIKLINVFMSEEIWNAKDIDIEKYFIIRTYNDLNDLVKCDYTNSNIKAFPLFPKLVEDDTSMDNSEGNKYYNHKVGGFETFCQEPIAVADGYEFIFQITSDEKAGLNIVDGGNFYFYYNKEKDDWIVNYDFY